MACVFIVPALSDYLLDLPPSLSNKYDIHIMATSEFYLFWLSCGGKSYIDDRRDLVRVLWCSYVCCWHFEVSMQEKQHRKYYLCEAFPKWRRT